MPATQLLQLPNEVLVVIIKNLHIRDVYKLILTCKFMKKLIQHDNGIWRAISQSKLIIKEQEKNKIRVNVESWYDRCRVSHNWRKGRFQNKGVLSHRQNYMPWLSFYNTEALLLSLGSDLHCYSVDRKGFPNGRNLQWKLSMPKIQRNDKRTNDISRFVLKDNLLVCGNRNGSVEVYKVDSLSSQPQRIQYIDNCQLADATEVNAVEIINDKNNAYLVTGSLTSRIVLFWNWDTDQDYPDLSRGGDDIGIGFAMELGDDACKQTVKCLALNKKGDKLAIGPDGNSKPALADIITEQFDFKSGDSSASAQIVQDIQWHDQNTLCYVTHSGRLQMMDVRTHQVVYNTRDPFSASFYCVKTDGNHAIIAGTSEHSRCVLYDNRKLQHRQLYFTQSVMKVSPVYSLDFDSSLLIAATARGVAALNFNVPTSTPNKDYSDWVFQSKA